ncbi:MULTISPECIES: hypothetical protein [unclassified Streptomyces]|uniref:hypothetical protein n=1 Tax=unclassified Streptomyces TaxID=2593676 RepID=UPI00336A1386
MSDDLTHSASGIGAYRVTPSGKMIALPDSLALGLLTALAERTEKSETSKADKGRAALAEAARVAADPTASPDDLRAMVTLLRCNLADMIMVAESRARQMVRITGDDHDVDDRPT